MATVFVNDKPIDIGNERLNCVQAAERAGIHVPHYCYHPALTVVASCRMCLVELGDLKDGKVTMAPKVFPGCQTPVKDGSVIVTGDYEKYSTNHLKLAYAHQYVPGMRAKKAQADTLEGLLLNHPLDCPVCDKAGECKLQDYSFQFGYGETRLVDEKNRPANKPGLSSKITLFTDRCIMCTRCVRFTREIAGTAELMVTSRGHHSEIDVFPGEPLENKLAGNVVDLCPVGALGSKDFLYKQRVWYLKSTDSVCNRCSTGCSISVDSNKDIVFRIRPRENPLVQGHFICDDGRHGYHHVNATDRISRPLVRRGSALVPVDYSEAIREIGREFTARVDKRPEGTWLVLSPFLTIEEAYVAARWFKDLSNRGRLALGRVPVVGQDDTYPKDRRGRALEPVLFTIRAEKCPNRRGVTEIIRHFEKSVTPFEEVERAIFNGDASAVFMTGGYPDPANQAILPTSSPEVLFAISEIFPNEMTNSATFVLPACTFTEKEGTYVNYNGHAQRLQRACRAPAQIRSDGQVFHDLLGQTGLFNAEQVRRQMASEIESFAALRTLLGELGTRLSVG